MKSEIGPYRILGELGRGGMGVVYRASDDRLGREVAVKALPPEVAADPVRLERFEREAKTLAQVTSQHIAGIYGVEEQDGQRFLILELVEGESLADRLDRGPIEPDEALELADQIAAGVEAAHEAGVVHRDLKPANIQLTPDGVIKVLDFGLARADEGQTSSSMGSSQLETLTSPQHQTSPGAVIGTAAYMSPEQARGRRVDKRTDIWAFGVVLYEMLTGASPFAGETATDSIGAVLHKDPDLTRLPKSVPLGVRRVLTRCLERDRNIRYRDIGDVRIELKRAATEPAEPLAAAKRGVAPALAILLALGLAVAGLAAGWFAKPAAEPVRELRVSVAGPADETIIFQWLDPQGRYILYGTWAIENPERGPLAFIRWLDQHESRPIEVSNNARWMHTSPDGNWLSFAAPVDEDRSAYALVKQVASLELPPVRICILPESNAISFYRHLWLSDDRFLLDDSRTNQVRWVDAESGVISEPVVLDLGDFEGEYGGLHSRVDDDQALVRLSSSDQASSSIGLLDMRTATVSLLIENTDEVQIGPDGNILFTRGSTLYGATFDLETATVGPAKQLVPDLRVSANELNAPFTLAGDGTIAFLPGGVQGADRDLLFYDTEGATTRLEVESKPYLEHLAVSPDESRLVVCVVSPSRRMEIWGSELESPRMRRVRGVPDGDLNYPFLGPDNDTLVYMRAVGGRAAIEVASFDGLFEPRLIVDPVEVGFVAPLSFHPSGNRVLVMWEQPEGFRTYEVKIDGSGDMQPVNNNGSNVLWSDYSPCGTMLAYTSDETGRREAYVRSIGADGSFGRSVPVTTRGANAVLWQLAPDRRAGATPAGDDTSSEAEAPFMLLVSDQSGHHLYPITPGAIPRVGDPSLNHFVRATRVVGAGSFLSDGRQLRIFRGDQEKPATHVELILNWYDRAAKIIKD